MEKIGTENTIRAGAACGKVGRKPMIAAEMKSEAATVRIHDEYYVEEPQGCLSQLNQIVSGAYRRKALSHKRP